MTIEIRAGLPGQEEAAGAGPGTDCDRDWPEADGTI